MYHLELFGHMLVYLFGQSFNLYPVTPSFYTLISLNYLIIYRDSIVLGSLNVK
jgi:hypothetical protein